MRTSPLQVGKTAPVVPRAPGGSAWQGGGGKVAWAARRPVPRSKERTMPAVILQGGESYVQQEELRVPEWVVDLESFRRWYHSNDFPEEGRIDYIQGAVWVDMSMEQVFSHNQAKQAFNLGLGGLVRGARLGRYFPDGLRLSNIDADLSGEPDGTFISRESMLEGNMKLVEGANEGYTEIVGVPDMVLEIVSDNSVRKDTDVLRRAYWDAGIKEYWLVDARGERLSFDVFRHTTKGYVATRKKDGWLKSAVFGKSFRLARQEDEFGHPDYTLEVR
jgi:Uma2 family endonuclease